jgi:hypothetical protein
MVDGRWSIRQMKFAKASGNRPFSKYPMIFHGETDNLNNHDLGNISVLVDVIYVILSCFGSSVRMLYF